MTFSLRSALPSLRAALRQPRFRLSLLALALLILGVGGYVTTRGGWVNALRLPPTLDASTPRSQNGWVLEDIQLPGSYQSASGIASQGFLFQGAEYQPPDSSAGDTEDAFGLWLTSPPGDMVSSSPNHAIGDPQQDPFFALAQLSTGETLPLVWHFLNRAGGQNYREKVGGYVFVSLPTGYSDDCQFVDITVSDRHNHTAHWHFSRLPRMRHAVPPPAKAVDTVTQNGITMSVKAWHVPGGLGNRNLGVQLRPILPPQSHQWDIVVTRQEREWEPFGTGGRSSAFSGYGYKIDGRDGVFSTVSEQWFGGGIHQIGPDDPYPRTNRFLRLTTELHQFETYDETVTFHNVAVRRDPDFGAYCVVLPKMLSQTTPSGVTVTLPAQDGKAGSMTMNDCLNVLVSTSPKITFQQTESPLPNSPLARAYGKPVHLSLRFTPSGRTPGGSDGQGDGPAYYAVSFSDTPPPPPVFKDFTIIVHQRVDIQTLPMTFTLPIADHSPPYYPKGYQRPTR